jgi:FHS family L-fucose permease-like MFS transporter
MNQTIKTTAGSTTTSQLALATLTSLFFMWGFITALNDILIPHLKALFSLSYTQAMLVQSCFFGAYFLISIPAGKLVSATGYQKALVWG